MISGSTARIVRFHEAGGPEVLQVERLPLPEPGEREVRLRVKALAVNRSDILFRQDKSLSAPKYPSLLGHEAAGVVEAIGPGVDENLVGKTFSVMPTFARDQYGTYGEVAIVPADSLAAFPDALSPEIGTSIWMSYLTAYGAVISCGKVRPGDFVLITAPSSSVGLAAIEIVKAEGAISIAVTRSAQKKAELLALGADHVIASNDEDVVERVQAITHGRGAAIIVDFVLGKGIEVLIQTAAQEGLYLACGVLAQEPTPYPLLQALAKAVSLRAYSVSELYGNDQALEGAKSYIFDHLAARTFNPKIAKIFTLEQIADAHRYMEAGDQVGKIVVTMG